MLPYKYIRTLSLHEMVFKHIKFLSFLGLLISALATMAQDINLRTFDYSKADSIALNFPKGKYKTYSEIVEPLTINLQTEQEKFRAIYRWISDNVSYSFSNKSDNPGKALTERKAVCAGYSSLLKQMCNQAGIECNVIDGWAKNKPEDIGENSKETNHAWDEVKLNDKWYLTDITWASGKYDFQKHKFYKNWDSAYFLPTPEFFIKQHFPSDKKMQMLDTLAKKTPFIRSAVWYENADRYGFTVSKPKKGVINQNVKKDFAVTLLIEKPLLSKDTIQNFDFIVYDDNKSEVITSKKTINVDKASGQYAITLQCSFPKDLKNEYDMNLYYGQYAISGFRMKFH